MWAEELEGRVSPLPGRLRDIPAASLARWARNAMRSSVSKTTVSTRGLPLTSPAV